MYINTTGLKIRVFHRIPGNGPIFIDQERNLINGERASADREDHIVINNHIRMKGLEGELMPDITAALSQYIGKKFGGTDMRTKRRTITRVTYMHVWYQEEGKSGDDLMMTVRKFFNWIKSPNVIRIKND